MFTRKDALALLAETFPKNKEILQQTEVHGELRKVIWTPEKRLDQIIDLHEPKFDALKTEEGVLNTDDEIWFRISVEHGYKNENGLWR